jgi:nucleoside-diphosphate-sugar epimerase
MEKNALIAADLSDIIQSNLPWEKLNGKTILVTGANGLLPSYLTKSILYRAIQYPNENISVIGLVRNIEKAKNVFSDFIDYPFFKLIDVSILSPLHIDGKIDFIIHAASQASPKFYGIDPVGTATPNTIGTYNLLNLAVAKKAEKFLFFSTSEVYGVFDEKSEIAESDLGKVDPTNLRSCYAESKRMGENFCILFSHQYGLNVSIVRPFHTYGPGLAFDDGRVFADFVANIVKRVNIVMSSDGSAVRSFCYIKDATIGFLTVLLKGEDKQAYNIANPEGEISIKELANTLVGLFPERNLQAIFSTSSNENYIPSAFKKLTPNIDKVKALGWFPSTTIADGFKKTILSYEI